MERAKKRKGKGDDMNVEEMINDMYEDKIVNLMDSGFELSEKSEKDCIQLKAEIVEDLIPMVQKLLEVGDEEIDKEIEDEISDTIYDYDNVWRNAIFNVFKLHNISDELLDETFGRPDELSQHIHSQWQV